MKKLSASSLKPSKNRVRTSSFDTLKALAAFFVVYLHTGNEGVAWNAIAVFAHLAVPLFFLITGYYYRKIYTSGAFITYFKKVVALTLQSVIFYFVLDFAIKAFNGDLSSMIDIYKKPVVWALLLFDNHFQEAGHLWYLLALIYVLGILFLFEKIKRIPFLIYAAPPLLLCNYFLSWLPNYLLYRNFLFTGLPYVCIGIYLSSKASKIQHINKILLYVAALCLTIMLFTEWSLYLFFDFNTERDHYLMTSFVSISFFLCAIRNPSFGNGTAMEIIGLRYSAYIYIYHKAVKMLLFAIFEDVGFFHYAKTFIVFGTTLLLVMIYFYAKEAIYSKNKHCKKLMPE